MTKTFAKKPLFIRLQELSWEFGELLSCYYGPLLSVFFVLYFITGVPIFLGISAFYMIVFLARWKLHGGSCLRCLKWPCLTHAKPTPVPLHLPNGTVADLYLHPNRNAPCIIFLFGGGFIAGHTQQYRSFNLEWLKLGFHVVQLPYSYWPEANLDSCLQQLKKHITFILNHQDDFFAPRNFALGGRSAGAYLAYMISTEVPDTRIKSVVGLYPPTKPQQWKNEWPSRYLLPLKKIYQNFFQSQDQISDLTQRSSYTRERNYFLITGEWDPVVLPRHTDQLETHLKSLNCPVKTLKCPTELHGFECNPNSFAAQKILAWLAQDFAAIHR